MVGAKAYDYSYLTFEASDGSLVAVLLNMGSAPVGVVLSIDGESHNITISKEAIQTIIIK